MVSFRDILDFILFYFKDIDITDLLHLPDNIHLLFKNVIDLILRQNPSQKVFRKNTGLISFQIRKWGNSFLLNERVIPRFPWALINITRVLAFRSAARSKR